MTNQSVIITRKPLTLLIHIISWGLFFGFPLFFMSKGNNSGSSFMEYIRHTAVPLSFLIVFYINYFYLINTYLFRQHVKQFLFINLVLVLIVGGCLHLWQEYSMNMIAPPPTPEGFPSPGHMMKRPLIIFLSRDILSLVLTVGLSVAIKMTYRWYYVETSRQELEKSKTEAELKNLKNQLNPHFLLNTLNNIYALIAFSPEKAQQAVHDLSKLLRYVLYDNNQNYVPLEKEIEFICNYIELMRIRLPKEVKVETNISVLSGNRTLIAPLLFISLIENAFKHGVSYSQPSFISINLKEFENGKVVCEIENSYFPKGEYDKSGSGIGLEQLSKRLELLYPDRYVWQKEQTETSYLSVLTIQTIPKEDKK